MLDWQEKTREGGKGGGKGGGGREGGGREGGVEKQSISLAALRLQKIQQRCESELKEKSNPGRISSNYQVTEVDTGRVATPALGAIHLQRRRSWCFVLQKKLRGQTGWGRRVFTPTHSLRVFKERLGICEAPVPV